MNKFICLIIVLTGFSLASLMGQSPSPSASPESSPTVAKHKRAKKEASPAPSADTAASPAASPEASPTAAKHKRAKKETSPAPSATPMASPTPKHSWFGSRSATPAPATSPAMSPAAKTSVAKTTKPSEPMGTPASGGGPGMVWVNTESHTYHKEDSRWYGRTKKGKYMSEQDAIKEGDHADKGEAKAKQ